MLQLSVQKNFGALLLFAVCFVILCSLRVLRPSVTYLTISLTENNTEEIIAAPIHQKLCRKFKCVFRNRTLNLSETSITAVTSFYDLGTFTKGPGTRGPQYYFRWMVVFGKILTDVIFYTDSDAFASHMFELRKGENKSTCGCTMDRNKLWSFGLVPRIQKVFDLQQYPRHYPNTVHPEYDAAMHAKYELMSFAVTENLFKTKYFAWTDVGVFRSLTDAQQFKRVRPFVLALPPGFNESRVAYTEVYRPDLTIDFDTYFRDNHVWLCGCFFLAERSVMLKWTWEYRRFVELLIESNSSSTDQQVLMSMYNVKFSDLRPQVKVQSYYPRSLHEFNWFYLAHLCRHRGLKLLYPRVASKNLKNTANSSLLGNFSKAFVSETLPAQSSPLSLELASDGKQPLYNEYR